MHLLPTLVSQQPQPRKMTPAKKRHTTMLRKMAEKCAQEVSSSEFSAMCEIGQKEIDEHWATGNTDVATSLAVMTRLDGNSQASVYGVPIFPRSPHKETSTADLLAAVPPSPSKDTDAASGLRSSQTLRPSSPVPRTTAATAAGAVAGASPPVPEMDVEHPIGLADRDTLPVPQPSSVAPHKSQEATPASAAVGSVATRKRQALMHSASDAPILEADQDPTSANPPTQTGPTRKPRVRKTAVPISAEPTPSVIDGETISGRGGRQRKAPKPFSPDD